MPAAPEDQLLPSGSPGPKARRLIEDVNAVYDLLTKEGPKGLEAALERLDHARESFYENE